MEMAQTEKTTNTQTKLLKKSLSKRGGFKKVFVFCMFSLTLGLSSVSFSRAENVLQRQMIDITRTIFLTMDTEYAGKEWKFSFLGWMAEREREIIIDFILENPDLSLKQFYRILLNSLKRTQDYHVNLKIHSTEKSTLPFLVKPSRGRYFVVHVDKTDKDFPIEIGDELLKMDGRLAEDIVNRFMKEFSGNQSSPTEKMLFSLYLTERLISRGMKAPEGEVSLEFLKKGESQPTFLTMDWDHEPELVDITPILNRMKKERKEFLDQDKILISRGDKQSFHSKESFFETFENHLKPLATSSFLDDLFQKEYDMTSYGFIFEKKGSSSKDLVFSKPNSLKEKKADDKKRIPYKFNKHAIGAAKSFLPDMGEVINSLPSAFYNYIFNHKGKSIGYVRIPRYDDRAIPISPGGGVKKRMSAFFQDLIQTYEQVTDLLIIDQIHNPGGEMHYLYILASMLTTKPLTTPLHKVSLLPEDIAFSTAVLESSDEEIKKILLNSLILPPHRKVFGLFDIESYTRTLRQIAETKLESWQKGFSLSFPLAVISEEIPPHPSGVNYSKPIIVLVDELSSSGGDFFPAILQDNKRATIFGQKTAGAGGYLKTKEINSVLGIELLRFTGSIALRGFDEQPIESRGVTPDVIYSPTPDDYQNNFRGYKKALLETVDKMLE